MMAEDKVFKTKISLLAVTTMAGALFFLTGPSPASAKHPQQCEPESRMLSGDFHQHTYYTDGSTSFDFSALKNAS